MLAAILGSIGVGLGLAIVLALIVWKVVRDKRAGKSFCGGNCDACGAGCKSSSVSSCASGCAGCKSASVCGHSSCK